MFNYNGIDFDDITTDEDNHNWSQVCNLCKEKHNISDDLLDYAPYNGLCGIEGCSNDANYYIDFPDEIKEV